MFHLTCCDSSASTERVGTTSPSQYKLSVAYFAEFFAGKHKEQTSTDNADQILQLPFR